MGFDLSSNMHIYYASDKHIYSFSSRTTYAFLALQIYSFFFLFMPKTVEIVHKCVLIQNTNANEVLS